MIKQLMIKQLTLLSFLLALCTLPTGAAAGTGYVDVVNYSNCGNSNTQEYANCWNRLWGSNECSHGTISQDEIAAWANDPEWYQGQGVNFLGDPGSPSSDGKKVAVASDSQWWGPYWLDDGWYCYNIHVATYRYSTWSWRPTLPGVELQSVQVRPPCT